MSQDVDVSNGYVAGVLHVCVHFYENDMYFDINYMYFDINYM